METETTTGLQAWLKARTAGISVIASAPLQTLVSRFQSRSQTGGIAKVGICMAFNRLMNFHVVRSTKTVTFSPSVFLGDPAYRHQREPWHVKNHADYPDAIISTTPKSIMFGILICGTCVMNNSIVAGRASPL